MAGAVTFKLQGGPQLGAAFDELKKATARNVGRRVLVQSGQVTANRASALAPDDPSTPSPDLHTSIAVGTKLTGRQAGLHRKEGKDFAEAFIGATEDVNSYAHIVEFGDANQSPQPFMRPAWSSTKDQVLTNIANGLKPEIDKAVSRARAKALKALK